MSRFVAPLTVAAALVFLSACASSRFRADGYHHPEIPLLVRYQAPDRYAFVSEDWRVDNFAEGNGGKPGLEKDGPDYTLVREVDFDGDGVPDRTEASIFDLKLVHRRLQASLWLRSIPLPKANSSRALAAYANDYTEALSGTGVVTEDIAGGKVATVARTYASKIVSAAPSRLGRFEAYDVVIELANVDQLKLDPASRTAKLRVVFARTDYTEHLKIGSGAYVDAPVLLMIGCVTAPLDFDNVAADFAKFLSEIDVSAKQE